MPSTKKAPVKKPRNREGTYDAWFLDELQDACRERGMLVGGHTAELIERLTRDDQAKHSYCPATDTFDFKSDPKGKIEDAWVQEDNKFDTECEVQIRKAWIGYYDRMIKGTTTRARSAADALHQVTRDRRAKIMLKVAQYPKEKVMSGSSPGDEASPAEENLKAEKSEKHSEVKEEMENMQTSPKKRVTSDPPALTSDTKTPRTEEHATSPRTNSFKKQSVSAVDSSTDRLENKPVKPRLRNVGYLELVCNASYNVRDSTLKLLENTYTAYAVVAYRADSYAYYMVFEDSDRGNEDLLTCYAILHEELKSRFFFDSDVIQINMWASGRA